MTSNRVRWEDLEPGTYEDMVSVLISRLHPEAQRIDGSGGDGGRDVQMPTGDGLVIFELKSFTGRMNASRRRQVESSLERASQHEPAAWRLVVPIDPNPGELDWFESLTSEYDFECRWLGECWLDGEMAHKPEIARYYAHGRRYELQEFLDLLRGIGAEPPPIDHGILRRAAERAGGIVDTLNQLDPHYVFAMNLRPEGRVHVSVIPRYPGAESDSPWLSPRFEFSDTPAGDDARRTLRDSVRFGTRGVIAAEHIPEMTLNVPAGLGAPLEGYDMVLGTPAPTIVEEVNVALVAMDSTGGAVARLPLIADDASRGTSGVEISLSDKSASVTATVRLDATELTFNLNWQYSQPDTFSPLDLLSAVKFAAAIEGGADVAVIFNGETLGPQNPGTVRFGEPGDAARYAFLLEHLVNVQTKTGHFFDVSTLLTLDEASEIVVSSRLLDGETVQATWERMELHITPDGREAVAAALSATSPTHNAQVGAHMSLVIQGRTIPIGDVTRILESARVLSWEAADDGSPPGTTVLCLVPADRNTVTVFLDTECT